MKKVLASIFCLAVLSTSVIGQGTEKTGTSASCCAKQTTQATQCSAQKAQPMKADCCSKESAKASSDCCSKEKVSKADCKPCDSAQTWMTEKKKCKSCQTASL